MSEAPYFYDQINAYNSMISPNTVHVRNTGLSRFFQKYLVQMAMSPFKITVPETWAENYFLYTLYLSGYIAVVNTDKFGVICQGCTLGGYNVFYQPSKALIANPLLSGILNPRIDEECTVIRLQPDYSGVGDIVAFYADLCALAAEGAAVNLLNSKLAYILFAKNKNAASSLKEAADKVLSGEPAVAINKELFAANGEPLWDTFTQDLRSNFIAPQQIELIRTIIELFCADVGLPNANTGKRERLNSAEVHVNNFSTRSKCEIWFDELEKSFEKTRKMFNLSEKDLKIEWREGVKGFGDVPDNYRSTVLFPRAV